MKILIVHNKYKQAGGEDKVVASEANLLRYNGNQVIIYSKHNDELDKRNALSIARQTIWSSKTYSEISRLIEEFSPDIIHVHNTLAVISPSVYWAASKANIPVVQTLHNFRLMCLNGLYFRKNKVCQDCKGKTPWRGIIRKCYRNSLPASIILATSLVIHRILGTYRNHICRYIALTTFARQEFIEGGISEEQTVVKPNFVEDQNAKGQGRSGFLFVGRLSLEKGLQCLADAAREHPNINIRIAGAGPDEVILDGLRNITCLGNLNQKQVQEEMSKCIALLLPSIWFEGFPLVILEAASTGTPVIGSKIGGINELIDETETGLLFTPGVSKELSSKILWANSHTDQMMTMGSNAKEKFQRKWTPQENQFTLINIYEDAISSHQKIKQ